MTVHVSQAGQLQKARSRPNPSVCFSPTKWTLRQQTTFSPVSNLISSHHSQCCRRSHRGTGRYIRYLPSCVRHCCPNGTGPSQAGKGSWGVWEGQPGMSFLCSASAPVLISLICHRHQGWRDELPKTRSARQLHLVVSCFAAMHCTALSFGARDGPCLMGSWQISLAITLPTRPRGDRYLWALST